MSRVAFKDLYIDYLADNTSVEDCRKVQPIEIVPRKMVEIIIEYCKSDEDTMIKSEGARAEAHLIRYYAESLLKQFEEDE